MGVHYFMIIIIITLFRLCNNYKTNFSKGWVGDT